MATLIKYTNGSGEDLTKQQIMNLPHYNDVLKIGQAKVFPNEIPPTTFTTINGHIKYERPFNLTTGGDELPPGSGKWYKAKDLQYIMNPSWQVSRLREEMAYAFANKYQIGPKQVYTPRFLQPDNFENYIYLSHFSDGTKVKIKMAN